MDWEKYKTIRNYTKSRIREYDKAEERKIVENFKGNRKKFNRYVRNKQKTNPSINYKKNKNNILTTEEKTAEALNTFLQSIFVVKGEYGSEDK